MSLGVWWRNGPHPLSPSPFGPHPLSPSPFGRGGTNGWHAAKTACIREALIVAERARTMEEWRSGFVDRRKTSDDAKPLPILRAARCPSAVLVLPFSSSRIPLRVRIVRIDRPVTLWADVLSLRNLVFVLTFLRQKRSHLFWHMLEVAGGVSTNLWMVELDLATEVPDRPLQHHRSSRRGRRPRRSGSTSNTRATKRVPKSRATR